MAELSYSAILCSTRCCSSKIWSREGTSLGGCINHLLLSSVSPFISLARSHHRLGFGLSAIYGSTFTKAASEQYNKYPNSVEILMAGEDLQVVSALASAIAGTMCILFGLFTKNEGSSRSLFLILCLLMAQSGLSLTLSAYSSAVDALVVAFTNQEMNISEAYIPVQRWTRLMEEASASRGDDKP